MPVFVLFCFVVLYFYLCVRACVLLLFLPEYACFVLFCYVVFLFVCVCACVRMHVCFIVVVYVGGG